MNCFLDFQQWLGYGYVTVALLTYCRLLTLLG